MAKRQQNEDDATSLNEFVFRLRFALEMWCCFDEASRLRFTVSNHLRSEGDATSQNEFVFHLRFAVKMRCRFGFASRLRFTVEMRLRFTVTNHRRYDVEMRVQCERQTDITYPKSFWSVYLNKDVRQDMSGDFSNSSKAECTEIVHPDLTTWCQIIIIFG